VELTSNYLNVLLFITINEVAFLNSLPF